jgi:hypothetical protein
MTTIRERLRKAIEMETAARPALTRTSREVPSPSPLAPVREAARQLHAELEGIHDLRIEIEADGVRIALYDKELWFTYDPEQQAFVGRESNTAWMDGGLREESFKWDTAEACTDAMIRATARYVSLIRAMAALHRV